MFAVHTSTGTSLLSLVATAESIAARLDAIASGKPVTFSHVSEAAHGFLVALIAQHTRRTTWIACPTVRAQEQLYETLLNWRADALFLPEVEFAAVENILPDPEMAAERLALLTRISHEKGPHLIVAT